MSAFGWRSARCTLFRGVLQEPTEGRILATARLTLGTVLSRVPRGAARLAVIGVGALLALSPSRRQHRSAAVPVIAAGAVPLMIGMVINIAKFGHTYLIPFEDQAWTAQSAARQAIVAGGGWSDCAFSRQPSSPISARIASVLAGVSLSSHPRLNPLRRVGGVLLEMQTARRWRPLHAPVVRPAVIGAT